MHTYQVVPGMMRNTHTILKGAWMLPIALYIGKQYKMDGQFQMV